MTQILDDTSARRLALDPTRSFIVQAPAGAGKTTLLVKRFLKLLSYVNQPEEILAITFTRKATSEMRNRIIAALKSAQLESPLPENHNAVELRHLASEALKQDQKQQWHLLDNPNRLSIQTFDAFCRTLVNQMPITAQLNTSPKISDRSDQLYQRAVDKLLQDLDKKVVWQEPLKALLAYLDNRVLIVRRLLTAMLAKRDQWLPHVINKRPRESLETGLKHITEDALKRLKHILPDHSFQDLLALALFAFSHQTHPTISKELLKNALTGTQSLAEQKALWSFLIDLLLTKNSTWRTTLDKRQGFPKPSTAETDTQKKQYPLMKQSMQSLIKRLSEEKELHAALLDLRHAPDLRYTESQWQILSALFTLLPYAVAQLKLIFQSTGEADFTEIAHAAMIALGTPENPTDLALRLDYQLNHLLIDEFQDTSLSQFRLIKQLTLEWQPDEGRTLFIVGDPMQSIYRFRDAVVGLFLRTAEEGINQIRLTSLRLSTNFRSEAPLIDWFNQTFVQVFPKYEDIHTGAVPYSSVTAFHKNETNQSLYWYPSLTDDEQKEAQCVVDAIQTVQRIHSPKDSIAILVRSRSHLNEILPSLRENDIPYQAIDIDSLKERSVIQDLWLLTRALLHPADRIAWLSLLRAPWCGLTLKDLYTIASSSSQTIWQNLNDDTLVHSITAEGQKRLARIKPMIETALKQRERLPIDEWVHTTWLALKGASFLKHTSALKDANRFFRLIRDMKDINDLDWLASKLKTLYATPEANLVNPVQILTIHRAKGLEFDHVILPALSQANLPTQQQLLLWMEQPRLHDAPDDLIFAPIKSNPSEKNSIYDYLIQENALKDRFECMRLLYVAATRAKKTLHLLGSVRPLENKCGAPRKDSLLCFLWDTAKVAFQKALSVEHDTTTALNTNPPPNPPKVPLWRVVDCH
jgi:ATP-dependent exoDNAse (exonuclease V) beta subunit